MKRFARLSLVKSYEHFAVKENELKKRNSGVDIKQT